MKDKYYCVSRESLNKLLYYVNDLFEVATFIENEYEKEVKGDFSKELLSEGVFSRLDKDYKDIFKLLNIICNDGKLTGEINDEF